jgi:hypothetical protein
MSRLFKIFLILILILIVFCFKGEVYRALIKYQSVNERYNEVLKDNGLIKAIDFELSELGLLGKESILKIAQKLTNENLRFTASNSSQTIPSTLSNHKANCVGYARLFNSICNYIIKKEKLENHFEANHIVAEIYLLNFDIGNFLSYPFFKDHDINRITNLKSGEETYFDPSLNDYVGIGVVKVF